MTVKREQIGSPQPRKQMCVERSAMKQLQGVNVAAKAQTNLSGSAKMYLIRRNLVL